MYKKPTVSQCSTLSCTGTSFSIATTPLCYTCVKTRCMDNMLQNVDGRRNCNAVCDIVCRGGESRCLGHHLNLLKHCRVCGNPRPRENNSVAYDNWYYCSAHQPSVQTQTTSIFQALHKHLPNDVIRHICTLVK